MMMKSAAYITYILLGAIAVSGAVFLLSLTSSGERAYGAVENIDGIPFPVQDDSILITEKLAHVDVYLREPTIFKRLVISADVDPQDLLQLDVGVREGEFWLSYPKHTLLTSASRGRRTVTVSIPLTDKLQDSDRSVDVMFFATAAGASAKEDEGVDDTAEWKLYTLTARTEFMIPSVAEVKDYLRSILKRERPA